MNIALLTTLVCLSLLLLTHDLVPLGRWNHVARGARRPLPTRLASTLLNSLAGLIPTWLAWRALREGGVTSGRRTILIILVFLLVGEFLSWWLPWLTGWPLSASRRLHLSAITEGTLAIVPERHGVRPDALHCLIHLLTLLAFSETVLLLR